YLVADRGAKALFRLDASGAITTVAAGSPLVRPIDVTIDAASGDAIVLDEAPAVHRISRAGLIRTLASGAPLASPARIAAAPGAWRAGGAVSDSILAAQLQDLPPSPPCYPSSPAFVALRIRAGCTVDPPLFCPDANVSRGQAAVFFDRAYKLLTVGDVNGT